MYTSMSMIYKKENCIYVLQQGLDLLISESGARKKKKWRWVRLTHSTKHGMNDFVYLLQIIICT